jgi:hypothetical protein
VHLDVAAATARSAFVLTRKCVALLWLGWLPFPALQLSIIRFPQFETFPGVVRQGKKGQVQNNSGGDPSINGSDQTRDIWKASLALSLLGDVAARDETVDSSDAE